MITERDGSSQDKTVIQDVPPPGVIIPDPQGYNLELAPYNPEPTRELVRVLLSAGILFLLFVEIVCFLILIFIDRPIADIKELVAIIFPSTLTLASAVIGFYFGTRK